MSDANYVKLPEAVQSQRIPAAARTRPLFKRSYKFWTVIRPVNVGGVVRERGYEFELGDVRLHLLRSFYNRRRVGPSDHPWTDQAIYRIEQRIEIEEQRAKDLLLANSDALIAEAGAKVEAAEDAAQVAEDAAEDAVELINKLSDAEADVETELSDEEIAQAALNQISSPVNTDDSDESDESDDSDESDESDESTSSDDDDEDSDDGGQLQED